MLDRCLQDLNQPLLGTFSVSAPSVPLTECPGCGDLILATPGKGGKGAWEGEKEACVPLGTDLLEGKSHRGLDKKVLT